MVDRSLPILTHYKVLIGIKTIKNQSIFLAKIYTTLKQSKYTKLSGQGGQLSFNVYKSNIINTITILFPMAYYI